MNTSPTNQTTEIDMVDVFIDQGTSFAAGTFTMYDLWQKDEDGNWGASVGNVSGNMTVDVVSHGVRVFKAVLASNSRRALGEL